MLRNDPTQIVRYTVNIQRYFYCCCFSVIGIFQADKQINLGSSRAETSSGCRLVFKIYRKLCIGKFSTALAVYIIFFISAEYSKNAVKSFQFLSHDFIMLGYLLSHFSTKFLLRILCIVNIYCTIYLFEIGTYSFPVLIRNKLQPFLIW